MSTSSPPPSSTPLSASWMAPAGPIPWRDPAVIALLAANAVTLLGVLTHGWSVFAVVLLFWMENVVVGVLNAARMAVASPSVPGQWAVKLFLLPFFCVHYGMFTAVHGVFVVALFGGPLNGEPFPGSFELWRLFIDEYLVLGLIAIVVSHGFSFIWNYLGKGEFRRVRAEELMMRPYGRVVVLHVTILFGGFLVASLGSPLGGLALLIGLKVALDLRSHVNEHAAAEEAKPAPTAPATQDAAE